jgi:protein-S-isoprenylcysteine O-methyltransferase
MLGGLPVSAVFALALLEYHVSEVLLVLAIEPEEFAFPETLLVTAPYAAAMAAAAAEHVAILRWFPATHRALSRALSPVGLTLVVLGEAVRKAAWLQARKAFTHRIKTVKRSVHHLVTHGVYSVCRHPGYLGWLCWAVGTQLLLGNVVCTVSFAIAGWRFFSVRIPFEDHHLSRLCDNPAVFPSAAPLPLVRVCSAPN